MKILKIEPYDDDKGFYKLFSEQGYLMSLSKDIIKRFNIDIGSEVNADTLNELNRASLVRRARERMLYSLDRRAHSKNELYKKLCRDYPEDIIETALNELEKLGLIDDLNFAKMYASDLFNIKKKGRLYIKDALYKKGIDRKIIQNVLDELFCQNEIEISNAAEILIKKGADLTSYQGRQKAYAMLIRRGYSYESAKAALLKLCESEEFYED